MLLHLYNPMLALPPTPPSAVSPGLRTVQGAGSAQFAASMLQPGLHWPLQHRAIPVLSPARWAVPLQGQCLLREMHLGWNFSCVAPSLLPARGFTDSSNCWTLLWCSRCVRPEAVGTALVPAALPALVPAAGPSLAPAAVPALVPAAVPWQHRSSRLTAGHCRHHPLGSVLWSFGQRELF